QVAVCHGSALRKHHHAVYEVRLDKPWTGHSENLSNSKRRRVEYANPPNFWGVTKVRLTQRADLNDIDCTHTPFVNDVLVKIATCEDTQVWM
ncbi:hypothetical protein ABK046_45380, partial [Streptomyces caeruleatus]